MSNAISYSCESKPSRKICNLRAVPLRPYRWQYNANTSFVQPTLALIFLRVCSIYSSDKRTALHFVDTIFEKSLNYWGVVKLTIYRHEIKEKRYLRKSVTYVWWAIWIVKYQQQLVCVHVMLWNHRRTTSQWQSAIHITWSALCKPMFNKRRISVVPYN